MEDFQLKKAKMDGRHALNALTRTTYKDAVTRHTCGGCCGFGCSLHVLGESVVINHASMIYLGRLDVY